tara:strand:+ start:682 stop:2187 length:1506 start_codon:yes stop_codon:yes gene_type:complete
MTSNYFSKFILRGFLAIVISTLGLVSVDSYAQQSSDDEVSYGESSSKSGKTRTYKKARVLQSSTAKRITKVVEALERQKIIMVPDPENEGQMIEKQEDDPDWATVRSILTELINKKEELKSYDRSVVWNYWGYVYFSDENYKQAMYAYEQLLKEPEATIPLRTASLYTLAQLYMVQEDYDKGIELILQWMDEIEKVTAQSYSLLSQAYFQQSKYIKARDAMLEAVRLAEEEEGYRPKENWYVLLAACYAELETAKVISKAASLQKQLEIYEILVNFYPKKLYFIQLGGVYSQMDREKDQMITYKAAYQKDLLDKEGEYQALAQLLLLNKNPYWAAKVLVDGFEKKVIIKNEETGEEETVPVVKRTFKNLKLLADSWRMAQEIEEAIPVLEEAAKVAKDGETFILLGNLYLFEDRVEDAVRAIKDGIKKGKLKKLSQAHLVLGQAYFELQDFDEAKKYFRMAARDKDKKVKKTANTWIKYAENEEIRVRNLALRREYIQQNS